MAREKPKIGSPLIIYSAFAVGLLSAIAVRVIIVVNHLSPSWVRPVWYFAVVGNFLFFYYRFKITRKRKRVVEDYSLIDKVQTNPTVDTEDKEALVHLLSSIKKSRENVNYMIIFLFSILAIVIDIVLSSMK